VTAIGTDGILVNTGGAGNFDVLNGTNVIARGGSSFVDIYAGATSGAAATVTLLNSNYATVNSSNPPATSITPPGVNNGQIAAPLLSADFHELAGSPTIDAGVPAADMGSLDLDHNPRVAPRCLGGSAGAPDIGAYEFPTPTPPAAACESFTIGTLNRNKKKGSAVLTVNVPGSGLLTAGGKGLKSISASPTGGDSVQLPLKASGKQRSKLATKGKVKLKVTLSWTPTGGVATTQPYKVKLRKKKRKS
jgi:hypothetical protein